MSSHKGIKLTLAIALLVSLVVVLGLTFSVGRTAANPIRARLLRKKDDTKRNPNGPELALLRRQIPEKKERTFKARDLKDNPLTVRQVRNLQSDTWHKDLEIEVKNISTKPIYSILAYLQFPDDPVSHGVSGFAIVYGERKYIDLRRVGDPQDPHLNPGDTYVFTIPEKLKKGLKVQHEKSPNNFNRLELHFGVISFGDGTGFAAGQFSDYRAIKLNPVTNKNHHVSRTSLVKPRSPPQSGCGSCARYVMDPQPYQMCWNYQANQACDSELATTESWPPCTITTPFFFDCDGDGVKECSDDAIVPSAACPGYSPTPTPTPTPSPSPSPTPETCASNCTDPNASFAADLCYWKTPLFDGCPLGYRRENGCCFVIPCTEAQLIPPACDGILTFFDAPACLWYCAHPLPTPMIGGNGGGGNDDIGLYDPGCTNYYWVWFYSYDGGETWVMGDIAAYAGCW